MSEKTYGKEGVSFPVKGSDKWIAGEYVKYRNICRMAKKRQSRKRNRENEKSAEKTNRRIYNAVGTGA